MYTLLYSLHYMSMHIISFNPDHEGGEAGLAS